MAVSCRWSKATNQSALRTGQPCVRSVDTQSAAAWAPAGCSLCDIVRQLPCVAGCGTKHH